MTFIIAQHYLKFIQAIFSLLVLIKKKAFVGILYSCIVCEIYAVSTSNKRLIMIQTL